MKIVTGKGEISLLAMIGIWSVSALTSLPGLAISPIMGQLTKIFPHATDLEIQMLTSLPSLLIIPFILLSGRLSEYIGYAKVLYFGLAMFFISGVLYFFSNTIVELILVSGLLGIGAGIIIPLSTVLISHFFVGKYRTKQFGYISAITNLTLVIATALTGYLAGINWRLPFVVYLLPIISLLMTPQIFREDKETKKDKRNKKKTEVDNNSAFFQGIQLKPLLSNMWYYFLITYIVLIISLNLPFLLEEYGYHSSNAGVLISLFFLAIMLPGFFINTIRELIGQTSRFISLIIMASGLGILILFHTLPAMAFGCFVAGFGYGIAQPLIYDNTASIASTNKVSIALALVMVMNYLAILLAPFIVDVIKMLFHTKSEQLPFTVNMIIALCASFLYLVDFRNEKISGS